MFTAKPATPLGQLEELTSAFGRGALADMLGRDPDTVTRYGRERRLPREVARTVDRFWYVVHRAVRLHWDLERARWFLLSIEPTLGRPPVRARARRSR